MGKQQEVSTTEDLKQQEEVAFAKASRKSLEEKLNPSIFGTDSTTINFGGINYDSKDVAGGFYGKAAEQGNWSKWSMPDDMAYEAFEQQTAGELIVDTLSGGSKLAVAGFLDMAGSWDLTEISNTANGKAMSDTGNWFQQVADVFQDSAKGENTIYQDGDNMWTGAYWANQGQQLGYSAGIITEMLAEQALLAYTTGGTGNIAGLAAKARILKPLLQQGAMGLAGGFREAYMNGRETQETVYAKFLQNGFTEEEAKAKADEAAHIAFKTEAGSLVVLNTLQNLTLFGGLSKIKPFTRGANPQMKLGFSSFGEQVLEKVLPKATSKTGRRAIQYGAIPAVTESIEEGIQSGAGAFGEWSVGDKKEKFDPFTHELRDSMIGGALGGVLLGAGAKAISKFNDGLGNKQFNKEYQNYINTATDRTANTFIQQEAIKSEVKEAQSAYNKNKSQANLNALNKANETLKEAKYNSHLASSINALQYDYLKGEGTQAFDSHVGQMQAISDAVKNKDIEALREYGLIMANGKERFAGSFEMIANTFEQNIKDSDFIKQSLEGNLSDVTSDFNSAFDITRKEFINSKHLQEINEIEAGLQTQYSTDNYASQLSAEGLSKFRLENELAALEQIAANNETKGLSVQEKARQKEIKASLKDLKYTQKDRLVIPNTNRQGYISAEVSKISLGQAIDLNNSQLTNLKNVNKITEKVKARANTRLAKAKTVDKVQEAVESAQEAGVADEAFEKKVVTKEKEVKVKEKVANLDSSGEAITQPVDTKPVENSQPEDTELTSFADLLRSGKLSNVTGEDLADAAFSRRLNNRETTDEDKAKAQAILSRKDAEFGREMGLEDLIVDSIKRSGSKKTEDIFPGLVKVFELAERDVSTSDEIYGKYFSDLDTFAESFMTNEQADIITNNTEQQARKNTELKDEFNVLGQPVVKPVINVVDDSRTNKSAPKIAFNFQEYEREGNVFTTTSNELKGDTHFILDSEFVNTGDKLLVEVVNDDSQTITSTDPNGKISTTTWGKYKKNIEPGSVAYNNKVPMGIFKEVDGNKVLVGFVHDSTWYTPRNITEVHGKEEQEKIAKEGYENAVAIRTAVLENNGTHTIEVTKRQFGSIDKINKGKDNNPITVASATGETTLARIVQGANGDIQLETQKGIPLQVVLEGDLQRTNNGKKVFNPGGVADIRYAYTRPDGVKVFMPFATMQKKSNAVNNLHEPLKPEIYNTLKWATLSSVLLNNTSSAEFINDIEREFNFTITDAKNIQSSVNSSLRVNIVGNLGGYLDYFVRMSKGSFVLDNKTRISLKELEENFSIEAFRTMFGETGSMLGTSFNVNYNKLNAATLENVNIPTVDASGKVQNNYKGYNDLVKNHLYSNVRSHEITKQNGDKQWIIDVQPVITYSLAKNVISPAQQAINETVAEINTPETTLTIPSEALENMSAEDIKLLESLQRTMNQDDTYSSRRVLSKSEVASVDDVITDGKVEGLTDLEFRELIHSLKNKFIKRLDFEAKLTVGSLKSGLDNLVAREIDPIIQTYSERLAKFQAIPTLADFVTELENRIKKLESAKEEAHKITGDKGVLLKELNKLFGLNLEDDQAQDENFSKSFLEKDIKLSYSNKLRMSFFGIKQLKDNSSQEVINDLTGLPKYESADYVELILKSVTTEIPSNWETLMSKLDTKYNKTGKPIYNQLKNNLKELPQNLKNELLYKLISSRFTAHKVINSVQKGKEGGDTFVLTVIDENSSKENIKLKRQTRNNFTYDSPLTMVDVSNNDIILNVAVAKQYQAAFNRHIKDGIFKDGYTVNNAVKLKEIFTAVGIYLSDNTVKEYLEYNDPFNKSRGILAYVNTQLNALVAKASKGTSVVVTDKGNNLFDTSNKALNDLVELEIALNGTNVAKSIRVGGKTLQGVIQNTAASDTLKELIEQDSQLLDKLLAVGYSKDSLLLNQVKANPQLRDILNLSFSSPDSYKINGKKNYSDTGYDKLSDTDGIISSLGLYTNERGNVKLNNAQDIKLGLDFRVGQMPFMTLSDKGRMLYMKTILLNATDEQIVTDGDKIELSNDVLDLLFEQAFQSEYNRILDAYANADPQVKSFSEASKLFTFLPVFNTLKVGDVNIHDIIKTRIESNKPLPSIDAFKPEAMRLLTEYINSEVNQKLDSNGNGIIAEAKLYENGQLVNIDNKYVSKFKGTNLEKGRKFFAEHAVNNLIHQVSLYQIFLGDMAYYTKVRGVIDNNGFVRSDVIEQKYLDIAESIGQVVDKRSASLIAPGFTLANASMSGNNNAQYIQLQLLDVNSISNIVEPLVRASKDTLSKEELDAFEVIKDKNADKKAILAAYDVLEQNNQDLKDYFDMEGTDAQEYSTWKEHIDTLFRQGNLSITDEAALRSTYAKLSEGKFDEVTKEETRIVMQPLKPVYTGMVPLYNENGEVLSMRPMYIKSSSFPLLPQVTKNLKIDNLRKNLEALEKSKGMSVRASYQTANKIGANKTMLTTKDLYDKSFEEINNEVRDGRNLLESATVTLDTKNFKIQQENPDKTSKYLDKNKDNEISMGSQFWKVITANGINKMTDKVFPNLFGKDLLDLLGVENADMLSGEDLDKINFKVYDNYSNAKVGLLYSRLGLEKGIPFFNLTKADKKNVLENILEILEEEVSTRNYPEYLTEALSLVTDETGEVTLESPIFLDSNANKFESLLLSLVANSTIFHKLPGLGHIASSSEGFEKISTLEELSEEDRQGITWFGGHTGRLKSTMLNDNTISESEVLIKSHYRRTTMVNGKKSTELIDFTTDTYSEAIMEDGVMVGRKLRMEMMDKELLSNFSFRIPTSSHQSGVVLKVVGFLPTEAGDMLLVPAEHTVQLGEDYDIDKRYIYKSNYVFEGDKITKLNYKDNISDKNEFDRLFDALLGDDVQETDKELKVRVKMYENAMIDIYKSVFQSPSKEVQQKIFKPLSVGVAKETSFKMDKRLNTDKQPYFSSLSDTYQRKLLKAGADGKGGIGVHSNAVTLEAQMQRVEDIYKLEIREERTNKNGNTYTIPKTMSIGPLVSNSKLGASPGFKSIDGKRDISDQHGENQNVATDNINEQIMAKRNENSYTMSVFALMASRGFDLSQDNVVQNGNKPMHVPSLFMNQPIMRDYVRLKAQQDSISGTFIADKDSDILYQLMDLYGYQTSVKVPKISNFMTKVDYDLGTIAMTGQSLYDNLAVDIAKNNNIMQLAVLQKFGQFKEEAKQLSDVQQLISLSTGGLGVSYFETLQRIAVLDKLPKEMNYTLKNGYKLIGEYATASEDTIDREENPEQKIFNKESLLDKGYIKIGKYYWKPETIEGVMLINSLKGSQDLMDVFFPYKDRAIAGTISTILNEKNIDETKKSKTVLEQKYEIMREMKSFMNTYENSNFFKGDVNEERRRLFMDSDTNTSIASIVKDIQDKKLPLSNNPFIRNLTPQIKAITEPSLLIYNSSESTSLDSYTEYDGFGRLLLDDNTVLGEYNGEEITPRKLAQDLVSYSMLADSQNGATGFGTLVPMKYLQIIGYNMSLNDNYNRVYNDPKVFSNFVEQYFQHNPERTQILSASTIQPIQIIVSDEKVQKKIEALQAKIDKGEQANLNPILQELQSFRLEDEENTFGNYVAVRNPNIKNSDNKFNLYKYNPDATMYEKIPTLGTMGLKEYNAEVFSQSSVLPILDAVTKVNKANKYFDKGYEKHTGIPQIEAILPATLGVKGILEKYLESANTDDKTKEFITNLLIYGNLDATIVYTPPANSALGQYNKDTNEIYIHPNIFDILLAENPNIEEVRPIAREILLEEVIHSMTVKEFDKYVKNYNKTTGELQLVENPPLFATKLVSLYQAAKESLPYSPTNNVSYYSKNIYEFMAGMFVAQDYREAIEKANPGIVKKFLETLKDMLGNVYSSMTGKTLSYQDETFNAVYDLLKSREVKSTNVAFANAFDSNPMDQLLKNDDIPTQEDNSAEHDDPFNCN